MTSKHETTYILIKDPDQRDNKKSKVKKNTK